MFEKYQTPLKFVIMFNYGGIERKSYLSDLSNAEWQIAVANTRLHRYDGKMAIFWYKDREDERHFVTMTVQEFIKALIQHIPDRNFKMIAITVLTAVKPKGEIPDIGYLQGSLRQATFEDFITKP
jgi:hypothetical protein